MTVLGSLATAATGAQLMSATRTARLVWLNDLLILSWVNALDDVLTVLSSHYMALSVPVEVCTFVRDFRFVRIGRRRLGIDATKERHEAATDVLESFLDRSLQ